MKKHVYNYFKHYGYVCQEEVMCEICGSPAQDLHHIQYGRYKRDDSVQNIIALCRHHHNEAHQNKLTREYLTKIHNDNLSTLPPS